MLNIPTWMAGQAKCVIAYDTPFWRSDGLSGDAMSRCGPLVEIHDACDPATSLGVLFGFIGLSATDRMRAASTLESLVIQQLIRLFGPRAAKPVHIHIEDWACAQHTAGPGDLELMTSHPNYGLPPSLKNIWDGRLMLSSTEMAEQFGGYLEGALEAAEHCATNIFNTSLS